MTPVARVLDNRRARTPRSKVSDKELRTWAEAAVRAAEPDRVARLERRVEELGTGLAAIAAVLGTVAEGLRDDRDHSDIACPCCGVRFDGPGLLDHVDDPPENCDRVMWESRHYGPTVELHGRDNR